VADWRDGHGRRHRKALAADRRVAERILASLIRERDLAAAGLGAEEAPPCSVPALAAEYLQDLRMRVVPAHAAEAARILRSLPRALQAPDAAQLAPAAVLAHLRARVAAGASNRTANRDAITLRACLAWAVRTGLLRTNPLAALRLLPAVSRRCRRPLTELECRALLQAAEGEDRANPSRPQAPFWRAMLETGARRGELAALRWADVDLELGVLHLPAWATKGRLARDLPIQGELVLRLRVLRALDGGAGLVFRSPRGRALDQRNTNRRLRRLLKRAGIAQVTPAGSVDVHALRHTCATRLARAGVDLECTRRILGHADPRITAAVYTHLHTADLAAALQRVPALPT